MTRKKTPKPQDTRFANPEQFNKVLLRWMPSWASSTPEGRLVAGIITQAWAEGVSWFFKPDCAALQFWCEKAGLGAAHLSEMFEKHNQPYAKQRGLA